MDHENRQIAEHAPLPPDHTTPPPYPLSRVTSDPEPRRLHGRQESAVDTRPAPQRATTTWQYTEETPDGYNWAAGPSHALNSLVETAERPEKRIRLDTQSSTTSVETVKSGPQPSMVSDSSVLIERRFRGHC